MLCISVTGQNSHIPCPFWFLCLNFPGLGPSFPCVPHFPQESLTLISSIRHWDLYKVPNLGSNPECRIQRQSHCSLWELSCGLFVLKPELPWLEGVKPKQCNAPSPGFIIPLPCKEALGYKVFIPSPSPSLLSLHLPANATQLNWNWQTKQTSPQSPLNVSTGAWVMSFTSYAVGGRDLNNPLQQ